MNDTQELFQELGGNVPLRMLADEFRQRFPDETRQVEHRALTSYVRRQLTQRDDKGLPFAASVDNRGTYMQRTLWVRDEYEVVIARYRDRSTQNLTIANLLTAEMNEVHGELAAS